MLPLLLYFTVVLDCSGNELFPNHTSSPGPPIEYRERGRYWGYIQRMVANGLSSRRTTLGRVEESTDSSAVGHIFSKESSS